MKVGQIDKLCLDWLKKNYGDGVASDYRHYSLVIDRWNTSELNEALESLRQVLCITFGPSGSFGNMDYHEAREKLGLPEDEAPIPDIFIKAFAGTFE
jgi:hypothetical protein